MNLLKIMKECSVPNDSIQLEIKFQPCKILVLFHTTFVREKVFWIVFKETGDDERKLTTLTPNGGFDLGEECYYCQKL